MAVSRDGTDPWAPIGEGTGTYTPPGSTPEMDVSNDLATFMRAVLKWNGGSYGGSGGAYGLSGDRWATMAEGAGLEGASFSDRAQQDYVAAWWMQKMFQKYRNWNLVAVAWQSGYGAADGIVVQSRKDPRAVTAQDIKDFAPDTYQFVSTVAKDVYHLERTGYDPSLENLAPLGSGGGGVRTIITGTGHGQPQDPFDATISELYAEMQAQDKAKMPSGAEMLFAQLEGLSNVVTGGTGRVDWRHEVNEASSGGSPQELGTIGEEDDDGAR